MGLHIVVTSHLVGPSPATKQLASTIVSGLGTRASSHDINFAHHAPKLPKLYPLSLVAFPGHEGRMEKFAQSIPYSPTLEFMRAEVQRIIDHDPSAKVIMVAYGLSIHPVIELAKAHGPEKIIAIIGISPIFDPPAVTQFPLQTLHGLTIPVYLMGSAKDRKFEMANLIGLRQTDISTCEIDIMDEGHHSFDIPSIIMNGKPKGNPHYKKGKYAKPAYELLGSWVKKRLRGK